MDSTQSLAAQTVREVHALARIKRLVDLGTLNDLFDVLERHGVPMGSERWAEFARLRILELIQYESAFLSVRRQVAELSKLVEEQLNFAEVYVRARAKIRSEQRARKEESRRRAVKFKHEAKVRLAQKTKCI